MSIFRGSATAMVTPFHGNSIDFDSLGRLIDFQLDSSTDALVMCGTTGEASTLSFDEKMSVIEFAVKRVNGRIPVIAGTGGNNTAEVIRCSSAAESFGANALLVVTPYYNKTTQNGLVAHYNAVADSVNLPIIAYNVPSRTGVNILPATMSKMLMHPNIVGIKEATGNIEQIVDLARNCPECEIYCGNDDHVVPVMAMGGLGVISTISNVVPRDMHDMCAEFIMGNIEKARELQFKVHSIWKAAFCEVNPIPVKTMLTMMGLCNAELRLPLVPPCEASVEFIRKALCEYGLIS